MKIIFTIIILLSSLFGVELEFNKTYEGGLKLSAPRLGAHFYLPPNWNGKIEKGQVFFMQHNKGLGYISAQRANINTVVSEMMKEQSVDNGLVLEVKGKMKKITRSLYRINYSASGGYLDYQGISYIVIGPQNRVIRLFSVFKKKDYTLMDNTLMRFAHSISFTSI